MHAHKITQLITGRKTKPPDLTVGPWEGVSKGFDLFGGLPGTDLSGLKFNIQLSPQHPPELSFQSDKLLPRVFDVTQVV